MGKLHCDHRIILRDQEGKIIEDEPFDTFASASTVYENRKETVEVGKELTLQHGARVISKTLSEPSN